jgi:hypothetical protein
MMRKVDELIQRDTKLVTGEGDDLEGVRRPTLVIFSVLLIPLAREVFNPKDANLGGFWEVRAVAGSI